MLIKLRNGLTLVLRDMPSELSRNGLFVLDNEPCDIPDLSIIPALYTPCDSYGEESEYRRHELILGRVDEML